MSGCRGPGTLVLVGHALTVQPLLGIMPGQAETIVLKPTPGSGRGPDIVGRIAGSLAPGAPPRQRGLSPR